MKAEAPKLHVVKLPDGEVQPLFVRASDIGKIVIGLSPKTAANWRSEKIGPEFFMVGGKAYYGYSTLQKFFSQNPVQTSGDLQREVAS